MKKKTKRFLPFWILLGVCGIIVLVVGLIFHFPAWLLWLTCLLLFGGDGVWILLHVILGGKPKSKGSEAFVGNRAVYERVSREINEAIARYLKSVNRRGFLKRGALYERPWFLVCGPEKSGKTVMLSASGLHFPLTYPSEQDGMVLDSGSGISWNFGNDAVWVDMPGAMMSEGSTDEWQATVQALRQVRSERAIDGVVMVIDARRIIDADPAGVKALAGFLRKRLDELIATWGIEFPVYLLISQSDHITGFNELFRDPAGKWHEQILGATLSGEQQKGMPRHAFLEEFTLLNSSLSDLRLRMLAREKNEQNRRRICRFVIQYEGLEQKLGNLVAELFKPSSYEGKPVFRGFYFTSCQVTESRTDEAITPVDISQTIANHPLNPHRMKIDDTPVLGKKKQRIRSYFTMPLFSDVIPAGTALVKKTQRFSRKEMIRYTSLLGAITVVAFLIGWFIVFTAKNAVNLNNEVRQGLTQAEGEVSSRMEAYRLLGQMGKTVARLKRIDDKGVPLSMSLGMYRGDRLLDALKKEYFEKVKKYILGPSMRYLEYRIRRYSESFGELSGDDYNALYRELKAYLSLSEAVSGRLDLIDTVSLRDVLLESITYALLSKEHASRLSENVETVLQDNIGLYMAFLKSGEFPLVQENQHLIAGARKRLSRLPNAQVLYETVRNRLSPDAQQFTLDDLLGRSGAAGILQATGTISILYTQEGWDQYVAAAMKEASEDPYRIDWVLGTSKEQMPDTDLDPDQLYEDMLSSYFRDVKEQWLRFIGTVFIEPFGDIARSSRILQKIGRDQSELVVFFERVGELTQIKQETEKKKKVPGALKKAMDKKTKKLKKLGVEPENLLRRKKGGDELADAFSPLRLFIRSESGSLGGLEGYRDRIITLSEKLGTVESADGDNVVAMFNGKDTDPLFSAWTFTKNELAGLSDEIARALEKLLLQPIEYTGKAVSQVLRKQMNTLWKNDVATPFTSRFAGRYPFTRKEDETVFSEVMDFFRPATGVLWGFYDRRLSPFIVKTNTQWQVRTVGTIEVFFDPKLMETLSHAERISRIFFQPDGTLRKQKITVASMKTNKNKAVFAVADGKYEILPGGGGSKAKFTWPAERGAQEVALKIYANKSVAKEFTYSGQWGLMRLFEGARMNVMNQSTFVAKWQVNVQNMYMIYFACKVTIAGSDHPFSGQIFNGFDVPMEIVTEGKEHS